jgi:hypothetical protein
MSHSKLRYEKNCLNCGADVPTKYCPECGQLNRDPNFKIKDLLMEFVHDLTHFDGKFFVTTFLLIKKPGFLTRQFIEGKRLKYLNPVRMYVFTSAIFFFIVYSLNSFSKDENTVNAPLIIESQDSLDINSSSGFKSVNEYELNQDTLIESKKDDWFKSWTTKQEIRLINKFKNDRAGTFESLKEKFVGSLPSLMFVSLPFLAFLLNLIFIRRKGMTYVNHLVFLIHFYIFSFIMTFFFILCLVLTRYDFFSWIGWVATAIMTWINLYPLFAMKNFYRLSWFGSIWRYFSFVVGSFFVLFFLFIIYIVLSLLKI